MAVIMGLIHVYNYTVASMPSIKFYAYHLMLGLVMVFLFYPTSKKNPEKFIYLDWIFIMLTLATGLYVILDFENYVQIIQMSVPSLQIFWLGLIVLVLVLEASRRVLGLILPAIAVGTILYALLGADLPGLLGHRGYSFQRIVITIFSDLGVYGVPVGVSASNVFLFLFFTAFLSASGADKIFQDLAISLAGKKRGGPAKMAVAASAFFGSISGSAVANVVSTGSFTIPLMKRQGYKRRFAGAVEAVASTGGQIMPPIMGAAAFILSDITGIPYATVCIAALLPALMYYICLFKMVDLESVKGNHKGISSDELPDFKETVKKGMKLFVPIAVLLGLLLVVQTTPMTAAIYATFATIICGFIDKYERMTFRSVIDGFVGGAKTSTQVVTACATSGIVVGMFALTGLGLKFSDFIIGLGGSNILFSLILAMFICIILGMGLPTTAAYIICATAIAPALIKVGVAPLAAHLFLLYYASISAITPPVAVASYAAAGIAEEDSLKVGMSAVRIGITGFILPYAFVLNTDYLHFGFDITTLMTWLSAVVVCYCVAISVQGYIEKKVSLIERSLFFVAACLAITPNFVLSIIGIGMFVVLYGKRKLEYKKEITSKQTAVA